MLKTNKQIKKIVFTAIFAVFMIPSMVSAGSTGSSGSGSWGGDSGWSDWDYGSVYDYTYTPNYSYTSPSYSGSSYGSSYTPSYGSYSYPSYSYGSSYIPSYGSSYGSSYIPSGSSNNTEVRNTNTNTSTSSSSASAVAVNNNNVYVYTNPTGNAVVYNPGHINLTGYCVITPSNPRLGQVVTATAYASGGVGDYTYTWGGDINYSTGAATSFTSYTAGTKNINVTIRSGQEVITKTCTVTFENSYVNNYYGYSSSVTTGTPVSGIYTQRITSGTPVSGVYLNELPATGISLTFTHYMIMVMTLILATVATFVYQARKKLLIQNI